MPIEVRELVVQAKVGDSSSKGNNQVEAGLSAAQKNEIIEECLVRVRQILLDKTYR